MGHEGCIACYLRQADKIYLTYWTTGRGDEVMNPSFGLLDMTVYGRREEEDSPEGWPQLPTHRPAHRRARCADGTQKRRPTGAPVDPTASPGSAPAPAGAATAGYGRVGPVGTEPTTGTAAQEVTSDLWCRVAPLRRTAAELEAGTAGGCSSGPPGRRGDDRGRTPVTRRTPAEVRATASTRPPAAGRQRRIVSDGAPGGPTPRADSSASGKLQRRAMRYVVGGLDVTSSL